MTKFEKVLAKFGLAYRSRLVLATENKDNAFEANSILNARILDAEHRLAVVLDENRDLRAVLERLRADAHVVSGGELAVKRARAARLVVEHG